MSKPVEEWLGDLLSFQNQYLFGPDRVGLSSNVIDASAQNFDWGLELSDALAIGGNWDSDLWPSLLSAWSNEFDHDKHKQVLDRLGCPELLATHVRPVADTLLALVKNGGMPYAFALLGEANHLATALRDHVQQDKPYPTNNNWLMQAINHPAGVLAEYWLQSLFIWRQNQDSLPHALPDEYLTALSGIVQDKTPVGTMGKAVLCRRISFLIAADYVWAKDNLFPLFNNYDNEEEIRAVWYGFIYGGPLNPQVAELMVENFLGSVSRLESIFPDPELLSHFVDRYTTMVVYFVEDPFGEWIPKFFNNVATSARQDFARSVRAHLQNMDDTRQRQLWERFLKRYWENRLQGVPVPLIKEEIEEMVEWLPCLTSLFPAAVELFERTPGIPLQFHSLVHRISGGDLWRTHPKATGKLLIRLGRATQGERHGDWFGAKELIEKLPQEKLTEDLKTGLNELVARLGLT